MGEDEKKVSAFTKNDIYYTDPMRISEQSQQTLEKDLKMTHSVKKINRIYIQKLTLCSLARVSDLLNHRIFNAFKECQKILGLFFQNVDDSDTVSELLIFVTPTIIKAR